jgi:DNA-binding LacI/PurR family transcriptional regulator
MKPANKRATISDVAKRAGVSKQTISRVINDSPLVSADTRARVQSAIEELGYRRSELARMLTSGRSHTIAVVGNTVHFYSSESYAGVTRFADACGYSLIVKELARDADYASALAVMHSLVDRQIDGILWAIPECCTSPWLLPEFVRQINVPVVFMNAAPRPGLTIVGYDNYAGAELAMHHLITSGRRHIAHIAGPTDMWIARERERAWRECLARAGLSHDDHQRFQGDWQPASGQLGMRHFLQHFPEVDAVFVAGDYMGLGAQLEAQLQGRKIPEDIAIIGFGNRPGSDFYYPPLTTIEQNKRYQGEAAFAALIEKIDAFFGEETKNMPELEPLVHQLLVRASAP